MARRQNANNPSALWERILSWCALFFVLFFVAFLIIRDRPFPNPNFTAFVRIMLSLASATWGATIPGMFNIQAVYRWSATTQIIVRASGAVCFFLVTYFGAPQVFPDKMAIRFDKHKVPPSSISTKLGALPAPSDDHDTQRSFAQKQLWKSWLYRSLNFDYQWPIIIRAEFKRAYLPFRIRIHLGKDDEDRSRLNKIAQLQPGVAFLVRSYDIVERQLDFVVKIEGEETTNNPDNDNELTIEGTDGGLSLLLIAGLRPRTGRENDFRQETFYAQGTIKLTNLDYSPPTDKSSK